MAVPHPGGVGVGVGGYPDAFSSPLLCYSVEDGAITAPGVITPFGLSGFMAPLPPASTLTHTLALSCWLDRQRICVILCVVCI